MTRLLRCGITIGFFAAALALILLVRPGWPAAGSEVAFAAGVAALVTLVPGGRRMGVRAFGRLRTLSPRQRTVGVIVVAVAWFVIVLAANTAQHRPFQLLWHDEHQFHLQSRMLAHGRLWMPAHELVDSFDTFYVLITPKYAPQSFPGAAMMFAPGIWLSLPTWVMPLAVAAVAMGLLWWLLSELVDAAAATVGLLAMVGSPEMRALSTMTLAQVPALLLGLVATIGWLHYRQSRRTAWVLLIGVALGWCLITRPLDAACYGLVVGVGVIAVWVRSRPKHVAVACLLGVIGATPFVTLQLVFNKAITGSVTKSPFTFYNERDQPALAFGGTGDLTRRPRSVVPQKHWFYDFFTLAYVNEAKAGLTWHRVRERIDTVYPMIAPGYWAFPLAAVGVLGLAGRRRWAVAALLPLFVVAYGQYPIYAFHYIAFAMPAVALLYALGPGVIAGCLPERLRPAVLPTAAAGVLGFGLAGLYFNLPDANVFEPLDLEDRQITSALNKVTRPAIVLIEAYHGMNLHDEPVYNDDVVWPDDAPLIRAQSLPEADPRLFAYYAARQPNRRVYALDRRTYRVRLLGNVVELARQFPTTRR